MRQSISSSEKRVINITAYHEAGHSLMAYFVGWSVQSIEIVLKGNQVEYGATRYNHGEDTEYIFMMSERPTEFNRLNSDQKQACIHAGQKRIYALMGGPIAENIFLHGKSSFYIDFSDNSIPDSSTINYFDYFLRKSDNLHEIDFVDKGLNVVASVFQEEVCWNSIEEIAKVVSTKYLIKNNDIEEILNKTGFNTYLEQFKS
ncbi:MAG: hypothetical protein RH948_04110 [Cyclobacteriaceae bacterium]